MKRKLIVALVLVGLVPLIAMGIYASIQLNNAIQRNSEHFVGALNSQICDNIDHWLSTYEAEAFDFSLQSSIQTYLSGDSNDSSARLRYSQTVLMLIASRDDIIDSAVYRPDGILDAFNISSPRWDSALYRQADDYCNPGIYDAVVSSRSGVVWNSRSVYTRLSLTQNVRTFEDTFALCRRISNFDTGEILGVLIWHVSSDRINQLLHQATVEGGYVILADQFGYVINRAGDFNEEKLLPHELTRQLTGSQGAFYGTLNEAPYLISYATSNVTGWRIMNFIPVSQLKQTVYTTLRMVLCTILVALVIIALISIYIANLLFKPVGQLTHAIEGIDYDNLNVAEEISSTDEIGRLAERFYDMLRRLQELKLLHEEEAVALRDAQLRALQSQINPHFLYNTLDNAVWLAKECQAVEIQNLLTSLARFYRISLSSGANVITLDKELEHLRHYLYIEHIRYGDKFDANFKIQPGLGEYGILKIVLQPLVENAIKHGIRPKRGHGTLWIEAALEGNALVISVSDDGVGMSAEQLQSILAQTPSELDAEYGYGVKNVNDRLVLNYGPGYALEYTSKLGTGTCVRVRIPACRLTLLEPLQ